MNPEKKLTDIRAFLLRKEQEPAPVWADEEMETKRQRALSLLGDRWLLHSTHSPVKGNYDGWPLKGGK